jgi:hypothetical protein
MRVTSAPSHAQPRPFPSGNKQVLPATAATPYRLTLSAPAATILLDTGLPATASTLSGNLTLDPANPYVALTIRWASPTPEGEHRFAKITLEPPGQPTLTQVFDATGDIEDLLEIPLPAAAK